MDHHRDEEQNIIVRKPGTPGQEQVPAVALHGHIDMVCKIAPGFALDFSPQGVKLIVDGHRIRTEGTTLGADNGLGISCILALRDSTDIPHPPLECVMTAIEEMARSVVPVLTRHCCRASG
ncbi:MAG: hypothetical protein INF93_04790 [Rhodobacter sp.]|nr:hypothetical protein [Rhodobacter sp.]